MTLRVAILDDYHELALRLADWSQLLDCDVTAFKDHAEGEALIERLRDFDIVCAMRERTSFPRAVFERLPNLKLFIVTGGRHISAFDFDAALERGIIVCRTDNNRPATDGSRRMSGIPELTFGLIVALTRGIVIEDRNMRRGGWTSTVGMGLEGATLGVLGLGRIGAAVARLAQAFGMRVIAWSQNLTPEHAASLGAERVDKERLFAEADIVSVHLQLSPRTLGIVGARDIGLMKPSAYFVNTSRGAIIDEPALVGALQQHRIAGAALDVFAHEPLPQDHPLRSLDNTILTPHIGYVLQSKYEVYFENMVENIAAWQAGKPIRMLKPLSPGETGARTYWVDA